MPRALTDTDKLRLVKLVGLWRPGMYRIPTSDMLDHKQAQLMGWYQGKSIVDGAAFGDEWQEYEVQYLGWDIGQPNASAAWGSLSGLTLPSNLLPPKPNTAILICGAWIHYAHSKAFAEILFRGPRPDDEVEILVGLDGVDTRVTHIKGIESIQNIQ